MTKALLTTNLGGLPLVARGKVRDLYALDGKLLFVATDRISAFDHVLGTGIPDKGKILTQISAFWFEFLKDTVANHLLAIDAPEIAALLEPSSQQIFGEPLSAERMVLQPGFKEQIAGRSMVVRRARMFPVECVVRGYLSGSGWKDYKATGSVCGHALRTGLREADRLEEPLFTPATKAESGHDENVPFAAMASAVGSSLAGRLRDLTLALYKGAAAYAEERGILLADTKFEFGLDEEGAVVWIDEALTPDSSRFWPKDTWKPGGSPPSYDKQFVRDFLEKTGWNKTPPAPALPPDVVAGTRARYVEAYEKLTGIRFSA